MTTLSYWNAFATSRLQLAIKRLFWRKAHRTHYWLTD